MISDRLQHGNHRVEKDFYFPGTEFGCRPMLRPFAHRLILERKPHANYRNEVARSNPPNNFRGCASRVSHGRNDNSGIQNNPHRTDRLYRPQYHQTPDTLRNSPYPTGGIACRKSPRKTSANRPFISSCSSPFVAITSPDAIE